MKKFMSFMLMLVLLVAMTGCGAETESAPATGGDSENTPSSEESAADPITIQIASSASDSSPGVVTAFEVEKILELANEKGATTISLTKFGQSPVSEISQIHLSTSPTREANFRSGATSSRLAQLHVMDILFMSVASKQYETTITYLDATREAIEDIQKQTFRKKKK